jgi:hypothetical protein
MEGVVFPSRNECGVPMLNVYHSSIEVPKIKMKPQGENRLQK